jgi:hypothetical protein
VPIGERHVLQPLAQDDAGVVDEDVEAAEPIEGGADRVRPVLLSRDVEVHVERLAAGRFETAHGLTAALVGHVSDRDLAARLHHQACGLGTDAARGTRNEGDLAVQAVHGGLLPVVSDVRKVSRIGVWAQPLRERGCEPQEAAAVLIAMRSAGNARRTSVPRPSWLAIVSLPQCSSIIFAASGRPSPLP